jgi:hypothetical protein
MTRATSLSRGKPPAEAAETPAAKAARLGPAGMRTFFNLARTWSLSQAEQLALLGLPRSTVAKYRAHPETARLSPDTLERISYLVGIYRALQILLPRPEAADAWIRQPNSAPPFGGQSALARMLSGRVADLYVVRHYLDGQRGW